MWFNKRAIPASYIRIYTNSHLAVFNAWPVHWPQGKRRARADCFNWFIQSDVGKISDKLVWVSTTVDLYHRTGNVRCVIHMSHDTPCHNVVWLSRRKRDDTGTPKNKNIHICMWSKVDGVLIGDIPGYFYSILVQFVHLETAGGWRWRYSGVFT